MDLKSARRFAISALALSVLLVSEGLAGNLASSTLRERNVDEGRARVSGLPIIDVSMGQTRLLSEAIVGAGLRPAPTAADWVIAAIDSPLSPPGTPRADSSISSDTTSRERDSLPGAPGFHGTVARDSTSPRRATRVASLGFFRSPTGTLLKSVIFPGWGQWTNGKKQKAVVYFGIETFFLTKSLIWRHRTSDRLREWQQTDPSDASARLATFNRFDSARNSRNYFYWLTGITVFISMFDAYSDAYLLTLERTRQMGDDYWGGQSRFVPDDELRLAVTLRF